MDQAVPLAIASVFILSDRPENLANFYRDVLGFPLAYDHDPDANEGAVIHYECDYGEVHFAIHPKRGPKNLAHRNDAMSFAMTVENLDHYLERLESHGVKPLFGPMELDFGRLLGIHDPDGNTVQFVQRR